MLNHIPGSPLLPRGKAADARRRFGTWRGERPFWAGLFTMTAGVPILYWPYANLDMDGVPLALATTSGSGSLLIGVLLIALGLALWYRPHQRVFAGLGTLLLALISFPVANFGGLFLGLAAGLVGGCLACSWAPPEPAEPPPAPTAAGSAPLPTGDSQRGD
ncbi:DUF6114 domain-containing protein [Streptomyces rubradiris]|uniref:SPW repeat-containing protein n=1 Tax=Streptomyces rubradiris TaxID=285531 RepID=A0ABQ3RKV1_STRRR|nr:DUF6114 domain-containing protein [Streptomyces rubradiris]GHH11413.1 hypothetical protein GCM10018792_36090 [Streptomyces rubradiris]GHI56424.1 hypothetical protein Srubr_62700 [Streptomyces rubradiris]